MSQTQAVIDVIDNYFALAYEPKSRAFHQVFHPSAQVQWLVEGRLQTLAAPDYEALIYGRTSPQALGAPRDEAVLAIAHVSDCLSTATVRVRIAAKLFHDHLVLHKTEAGWRIASKSSFIAATFD